MEVVTSQKLKTFLAMSFVSAYHSKHDSPLVTQASNPVDELLAVHTIVKPLLYQKVHCAWLFHTEACRTNN